MHTFKLVGNIRMTKRLSFIIYCFTSVVTGSEQTSSAIHPDQESNPSPSSFTPLQETSSKKNNPFKWAWGTQSYQPLHLRQRRAPGLFPIFEKQVAFRQRFVSRAPKVFLDARYYLNNSRFSRYSLLPLFFNTQRRQRSVTHNDKTNSTDSCAPKSLSPPPPPPFVRLPVLVKEKNVYYQNIIERTYTKPMIKRVSSFIPPPPPPPQITTDMISARQKSRKVDQILKHPERSFAPTLDQIPETPDASLLKRTLESGDESLLAETKEKTHDFKYYPLLYFYQLTSRYVILDTEATGLGHGHAITEIGCVEIKNLQRTGNKFHVLINPERDVSAPAHKITGHTWKKLSKYPSFCGVSQNLLRFFGNSPLVLHNQHYDLKLINESLNYSEGTTIKLEKEHIVIDSQPFAKSLLPSNKVGLRALAQHFGIASESSNHRHAALDDAEMLTDVFMQLLKLNSGNFPNNSRWLQIPPYEFDKELQTLELSPGKYTFQNLGFNLPLPKSLFFSMNMFHPKFFENFPAIIMLFKGSNNSPKGVLVKYDFNNQPLKYKEDPTSESEVVRDKQKLFFGVAEDATLDVHSGSPKVTFVGQIINALIAKEILQGDRSTTLLRNLNIDSDYDIKACVDLVYLPSLTFDIKMRRLIVLVDHLSTSDAQLSVIITKMLEKMNNQSVGLFNKIKQQSNLVDYVIKLNGWDWSVTEDIAIGSQRQLTISSIEQPESLYITINMNEKTISINDMPIEQPNSILVTPPKISLEIIAITSEADGAKPAVQVFRSHKDLISRKFNSSTSIKSLKDLVSVNKTEVARKLYEQALEINQDSPVTQYFKKRRIDLPLPASFRWMSNVYHPWVERNLPLTLVPLYNEKNVIVGVHRLFCDNDGSVLKYTPIDESNPKKIPFKLSLGRTVGAAVEVFRDTVELDPKNDSNDNHVMLISEGIENALVARDVFVKTKREHPNIAKKLFKTLNIESSFSIKACVGINGLIDIPIDPKTQTIVILADNDYINPDAKQTMINTVKHFLKKSLRTFIVLPRKPDGGKIDLNDVLLNCEPQNSLLAVATVMSEAVEIRNIEELGDDNNIPLEVNLRRLAKPQPNASLQRDQSTTVTKALKTPLLAIPSLKVAPLEKKLSDVKSAVPLPKQPLNKENNEHKKGRVTATNEVTKEVQQPLTASPVDTQYKDLISDPFWHNNPITRNARRK